MANLRSARTVTLLEVVVLEGKGTPDSVYREVTAYYTPEGELVAQNDPGATSHDYMERLREVI